MDFDPSLNWCCAACGDRVTAFELEATTGPEATIGRPMCSYCIRHGGYLWGWADSERKLDDR